MNRLYLDNCCYNRPYDDQTQIRISLEAQAKLYVQDMIRDGKLELVSSYMLLSENSRNPYDTTRKVIERFLEEHTSIFIDETFSEAAEEKALQIMATGVKPADAIHIACAMIAECDYFLTTDDRLLKYGTPELQILNPFDFLAHWRDMR